MREVRDIDIVCDQQVLLAVGLYARASVALPVYHEDFDYDGHHGHHGHHALPPATSYATISTTHVKVQHPPAAPPKYSTAVAAPYKVSETVTATVFGRAHSTYLKRAGKTKREPDTPISHVLKTVEYDSHESRKR